MPTLRRRVAWLTALATSAALQLGDPTTTSASLRQEWPRRGLLAPMLAPLFLATSAQARPEGVNKPELLPPKRADGSTPTVIDVGVNYLTKGQQKRLEKLIADLEKSAGWRVRVLCQRYPETPGLAIRDYWKVDDKTIVLVADKGSKGTANILNFNVGADLDDVLPTVFWSRLQSAFGTTRYYRENGDDVAILNAVEAIVYCAPDGCISPPSDDKLSPKVGL